MARFQITVRAGGKAKTFVSSGGRVRVGQGPDCDLVLPFAFVREEHMVVDMVDGRLMARAAAGAPVKCAGRQLAGDEWCPLPSPATITLPNPQGDPVILEVARVDADVDAALLCDGEGGDEPNLAVVSKDRIGTPGKKWFAGETPAGKAGDIPPVATAQAPRKQRISPTVLVLSVSGFYLVLIAGALGFNRYRAAADRLRYEQDAKVVKDHLEQARDLLARKDYAGAKAALDAAEPVAKKHPALAESTAMIEEMREKPQIQFGAAGQVEMDGRWMAADLARQWKTARDRDDPKIAALKDKASAAMTALKFDDARAACEEAMALMEAHPVKPHPQYEAVKAMRDQAKESAVAAEMAAKGFVSHQGKWVTKEEKYRLDQAAKGLVEYQGMWMTKAEMEEAQRRGGTGRVYHNGKWMTTEEKLQAEGYVQFDGRWMKTDERDAILKKRAEEAKAEQEKAAAAKRAEEEKKALAAKAETMKKPAYEASQSFLRQQLAAGSTADFPLFNGTAVEVIFDDGWYIVKAHFDAKVAGGATVKKTGYCKLRPAQGGKWEVETTLVVDK